MKALSLWEPWASLVRLLAKKYETRSWATSYRGPLLICASKKRDEEAMMFFRMSDVQKYFRVPEFEKYFMEDGGHTVVSEGCLNFGKAVALVDVKDCIPTEKLNLTRLGLDEEYFGNYGPGRFAWKLEMVDNTFEPFPVRGAQGLFDVEVKI